MDNLVSTGTKQSSDLLHHPLWQQAFHKLPQVLPGDGVVEEGHFAVNEPQNGGGVMGTKMVGQPLLIPNVHHPDPNT